MLARELKICEIESGELSGDFGTGGVELCSVVVGTYGFYGSGHCEGEVCWRFQSRIRPRVLASWMALKQMSGDVIPNVS